jgi:hypothetical protein
MAGLSNLIANTETKATTLPSWMNTAQQNVVNQATAASGNVPQLQNTVAQGAINQLSSPQNPFTQAQTPLNTIASGAANPWIVDQSTGNVTPNINTPLGGLFQAQNQQLQQLAPNIMAQPTAAGIGAGQFGSLRTDTAADKALADAQAQLFTAQNQAALSNQQTGVQAANVMGNVANQYGTTAGNLANLQQTSPFSAASSLGKVISGLNVPTTETSSAQISPLNQLIAAGGALQGGTAGLNAFLNQISPGASISSVYKSLFGSNNPFSTNIPGSGQTTVPIDVSGGGYGDPVSGTGASGGAGAGQILGTDGNIYNDPTYGTGTTGGLPGGGDYSMGV